MGSQQSIQSRTATLPSSGDLHDLHILLLPYINPEGLSLRSAAWAEADPNSNGVLSLAELEAWLQRLCLSRLGGEEGLRIFRKYRPSYIRAFADARDIAPPTEGLGGDDYVTKREFRLCIIYFCIYAAFYDSFHEIDGGKASDKEYDRRMTREEWTAAHDRIVGGEDHYGFTALEKIRISAESKGADDFFGEMDSNGKGMVLLTEWCDYLKRAEIESGTEVGKMLAAGDEDVLMLDGLKINQ